MFRRIAPLALVFSAALAGKAPMQRVDVTTAKSADYTAGSTIRIEGTAGELNIEAWDQPRVEATLTRTEYADASYRDGVRKDLERIGLMVEKRGNEVVVDLTAPKRHFWGRWVRGKTNATLVCRVMVPRDAKLIVRHEDGGVLIYGAAGDIDASSRFGDIVVQLAEPGQYSIDAQAHMGGVYTDYDGRYRRRLKVGEKYLSDAPAGAHKVMLRVRIGGIDIVKIGAVAASGF